MILAKIHPLAEKKSRTWHEQPRRVVTVVSNSHPLMPPQPPIHTPSLMLSHVITHLMTIRHR